MQPNTDPTAEGGEPSPTTSAPPAGAGRASPGREVEYGPSIPTLTRLLDEGHFRNKPVRAACPSCGSEDLSQWNQAVAAGVVHAWERTGAGELRAAQVEIDQADWEPCADHPEFRCNACGEDVAHPVASDTDTTLEFQRGRNAAALAAHQQDQREQRAAPAMVSFLKELVLDQEEMKPEFRLPSHLLEKLAETIAQACAEDDDHLRAARALAAAAV